MIDPLAPGEIGNREYPRTWWLLEVVRERLALRGHEVVDLSPGAIELRHAARELRRFAESRDRWLQVAEESNMDRLAEGHHRELSFGPDLRYCVERDTAGALHNGEPFRHLCIRFGSRVITPATSAEIGLYFYGRRPALFGLPAPDRAHGFIGMDWEPLSQRDARTLLRRECRSGGGSG